MVNTVMTPAEIEEQRQARNAKIMGAAKWAPLALAGVLFLGTAIGAGSAIAGGASDAELVKSTIKERTVDAKEAEANLAEGFEALVLGVTGFSAERAAVDVEVIDGTLTALVEGSDKALNEAWPVSAEDLGALDGDVSITLRTAGIAASDYVYFAVVTAWSGEPETKGSEIVDSVAVELTIDKNNEIVTMKTSPAGIVASDKDSDATNDNKESR